MRTARHYSGVNFKLTYYHKSWMLAFASMTRGGGRGYGLNSVGIRGQLLDISGFPQVVQRLLLVWVMGFAKALSPSYGAETLPKVRFICVKQWRRNYAATFASHAFNQQHLAMIILKESKMEEMARLIMAH